MPLVIISLIFYQIEEIPCLLSWMIYHLVCRLKFNYSWETEIRWKNNCIQQTDGIISYYEKVVRVIYLWIASMLDIEHLPLKQRHGCVTIVIWNLVASSYNDHQWLFIIGRRVMLPNFLDLIQLKYKWCLWYLTLFFPTSESAWFSRA